MLILANDLLGKFSLLHSPKLLQAARDEAWRRNFSALQTPAEHSLLLKAENNRDVGGGRVFSHCSRIQRLTEINPRRQACQPCQTRMRWDKEGDVSWITRQETNRSGTLRQTSSVGSHKALCCSVDSEAMVMTANYPVRSNLNLTVNSCRRILQHRLTQ